MSFIGYSTINVEKKKAADDNINDKKGAIPKQSVDKSIKCKYCSHTFSRNSNLKEHTIRLHTGEKKFECKECLKKFMYNSSLTKHMKSHIKRKVLECKTNSENICPKVDLTTDIPPKQTEENPFEGEGGLKTFKEKFDLSAFIEKDTEVSTSSGKTVERVLQLEEY